MPKELTLSENESWTWSLMVALLAFRQPEDLKFQILELDSILLGRAALFPWLSICNDCHWKCKFLSCLTYQVPWSGTRAGKKQGKGGKEGGRKERQEEGGETLKRAAQ